MRLQSQGLRSAPLFPLRTHPPGTRRPARVFRSLGSSLKWNLQFLPWPLPVVADSTTDAFEYAEPAKHPALPVVVVRSMTKHRSQSACHSAPYKLAALPAWPLHAAASGPAARVFVRFDDAVEASSIQTCHRQAAQRRAAMLKQRWNTIGSTKTPATDCPDTLLGRTT